MSFCNAVERSVLIRKLYHQLEKEHHGKEWTVEEDALAFLQTQDWWAPHNVSTGTLANKGKRNNRTRA
jgi:hypothetical protein